MTDKERDNSIRDNNLGQNIDSRFLRFVNLKVKKLIQATYLVTSFISDSEPLKWRVRDSVLDLLSDTNLLVPPMGSADGLSETNQISPLFKISVLESVLNRLEQTTSLFEVALAANFASEMNFSILKNEFNQLQKEIKLRLGRGLKEVVELGEVAQLPEGHGGHLFGERSPNIGHSSFGNFSQKESRLSESVSRKSSTPIKDNLAGEGERKLVHRLSNKDSRRGEIVTFLKGKSWTSIKDISEAIPGCSTKTIQRELSELVQSGVLKKKGDRRWSRYLLA